MTFVILLMVLALVSRLYWQVLVLVGMNSSLRKDSKTMKKNLMSVLILALLVVNLVLTAITMISLAPAAKQTNTLISEVCTALDLELASGRNANASNVPIDKLKNYSLADPMTINLTDSDDGESHYAVVSFGISMDTSHEDYETIGEKGILAGEYDTNIKQIVNHIVTKYTFEQFKNHPEDAEKEILEELQGFFDTGMIVDMGFSLNTCE